VTVIEAGQRLISREDEDISAAIGNILEAENIDIRVKASGIRLAPEGDGIKVTLSSGGAHTVLDQMYARQPYDTMQRAMHIHPTVSELLPTMLGELQPG
jgi:hypothetical protein